MSRAVKRLAARGKIGHPGYGLPPDCSVITWEIAPPTPAGFAAGARRTALSRCDTLRLVLRSRTPAGFAAGAVRSLQLALTEDDGTPWGTDIAVPPGWGTVEVPVAKLAFFGPWAHPAGRGGPGDHPHLDRLAKCTLALGAWLNPDHAAEPHVLQVERMELVASRAQR
jgi:hypothetical protein